MCASNRRSFTSENSTPLLGLVEATLAPAREQDRNRLVETRCVGNRLLETRIEVAGGPKPGVVLGHSEPGARLSEDLRATDPCASLLSTNLTV